MDTRLEGIARALPDVEVVTAWGKLALKVRGKMFAAAASHSSAEPNSLVVWMDFADRDALLADDPDTYYVKDHYRPYPCIVVRLSRVGTDALRDLLVGAHRYVGASARRRTARAKKSIAKTR